MNKYKKLFHREWRHSGPDSRCYTTYHLTVKSIIVGIIKLPIALFIDAINYELGGE
jgi:hypothetical protein